MTSSSNHDAAADKAMEILNLVPPADRPTVLLLMVEYADLLLKGYTAHLIEAHKRGTDAETN